MSRNAPAPVTIAANGTSLSFLVLVGCGLPPVENPGLGLDTDGYEQFYVDEQAFYTQPIGGCSVETPLTPLADDVRDALEEKGWFGMIGEDANDICSMPGHKCAIPTDYVEEQDDQPDGLVGHDGLYGDAATFSVFTGHGAHNLLAYRRPSVTPGGSNVCQIFFSDRVRLGIAGGNRARVAAFAASCVGYAADLLQEDGADDFRDGLGQSNSWHHLTFYDSPTMDTLMFPNFVTLSGQGKPTTEAWISATEFNPPLDYNQPIVYTTYNSVADAGQPFDYLGTRHEFSRLLTGAELPPTAPTMYTAFMYTYSLDDGDDDNNDPMPSECADNIPGN